MGSSGGVTGQETRDPFGGHGLPHSQVVSRLLRLVSNAG